MSKFSDALAKATGKSLVDPETAAAHDRMTVLRERADDISARLEKRNAEAFKLETSLPALALAAETDGTKLKDFEATQASLAAADRDIARMRSALEGAREGIRGAEAEFNRIGVQRRLKDLKRKNGEREKAAEAIVEHAQALGRAWRAYFVATRKIVAVLPFEMSNKGGLMTRQNEILEAMEMELRRANQVEATIRSEAPPLPGANTQALVSNLRLVPFTDATMRAGEHALKLLEAAGAPEQVPGPKKGARREPSEEQTIAEPPKLMTVAEAMMQEGVKKHALVPTSEDPANG